MADHTERRRSLEQAAGDRPEFEVPGLRTYVNSILQRYPQLSPETVARILRLPTDEIERLTSRTQAEV